MIKLGSDRKEHKHSIRNNLFILWLYVEGVLTDIILQIWETWSFAPNQS